DSGFLAVPYAYAQMGWIPGCLFSCLAYFIHTSGCRHLTNATRSIGATSYEEVVRVVGGRGCSKPIAIIMTLENYMYLVTFIVVAGDYLLGWVPRLTVKSSRLLASCFTMLPLSFIPDLRRLDGWLRGLGQGLPLLALALGPEFAVSSLYNSVSGTHTMRGRTVMRGVTWGLAFTLVMELCFGVAGSAVFGTETSDDLLLNFVDSSALTSVLKVLMALVVTCAYPLIDHCSREGAISLITSRTSDLATLEICLSLCLYVCALLVAMVTPDISTVLVFSSATFGSVLYFYGPALVALRFVEDPPSGEREGLLSGASTPLTSGVDGTVLGCYSGTETPREPVPSMTSQTQQALVDGVWVQCREREGEREQTEGDYDADAVHPEAEGVGYSVRWHYSLSGIVLVGMGVLNTVVALGGAMQG
ncbi:hypothetical protein KIPB_003227, partial [Kipferlia bialata]